MTGGTDRFPAELLGLGVGEIPVVALGREGGRGSDSGGDEGTRTSGREGGRRRTWSKTPYAYVDPDPTEKTSPLSLLPSEST